MLHFSFRPSSAALRRGGLLAAALSGAVMLSGCSTASLPVINTIGPIATDERNLLFIAFGLMMIVVIPVWVMAIWFPIKYRASNTKAEYRPHWDFSPVIETAIWLVPALIVLVIGIIVWNDTHRLDPYRPLPGGKPLRIEAISLDWKWLFVYPDRNIATVNLLVLPAKQPVMIELTSDTVMNSFYLPGIAGQIYAMAGMRTEMNLKTDRPDVTTGLNTMFSGGLFPDQHFEVNSMSRADFDKWVAHAQQTPKTLTLADYNALSAKRDTAPTLIYSGVVPGLFDKVIAKYMGAGDGMGMNMGKTDMPGTSNAPAAQANPGN